MNKQLLAKIISVLIVINVLLNPLSISLGQVDPTPVATSESHLNVDNTATDSNNSALGTTPEGISTDSAQLNNTGSDTAIRSQLSEENTITNTNNNDINLDKQIQDSNITGQNNANDNVSLGLGAATAINTGDAKTADTLSTVVNTNIIATQAQVVLTNITDPQNQNLDLSNVMPCSDNSSIIYPDSLDIKNTGNKVQLLTDLLTKDNLHISNLNQANIDQSASLQSITGQNQAEQNVGVTAIHTGDASNNLNSVLVANTNLVGNCWFFGVINLFSEMHGDIILPYELPIINHTNTSNLPSANNQTTGKTNYNLIVNNDNQANLNTAVATDANTGANDLTDTIAFGFQQTVLTGSANSVTNQYDLVNTNITGSHFLLLRINRYANWYGSVVGWDQPIMSTPDYMLLIFDDNGKLARQLVVDSDLVSSLAKELSGNTINTGSDVAIQPNSDNSRSLVIDNINKANINNGFSLVADTGNNSVGRFNPEILTGDATNRASVFNMINTNITGDNWFFGVVNIFADFFGNIVFPRADLAITKYANKSQVQKGEEVNYKIHVENKGQIDAQNVIVSDTLPTGAEFVSASDNGVYVSGKVIWQFNEIKKYSWRDAYLTVKISSQANTGDWTNNVSASTTTEEVNKIDNSTVNTILIKDPDAPSSQSGASSSNNQPSGDVIGTSSISINSKKAKKGPGKTIGVSNQHWFRSDPVAHPKPTISQSLQRLWRQILKMILARDAAIGQKIRQKFYEWFFVAVPKYILQS